MDLPPPILSGEEKLHALRILDQYRYWHSLDDKRYCRGCAREITGHQVIILKAAGSAMQLGCPTAGCSAKVGDWRYVNPVLVAMSKMEEDRAKPAPQFSSSPRQEPIPASNQAGR